MRALSGSRDGTLRLWDLQSGAEIAVFVLGYAVQCCTFWEERNRIVVGDTGGFVKALELVERGEIRGTNGDGTSPRFDRRDRPG